nr:hypothetical protein [Natronoglycomyces albus]
MKRSFAGAGSSADNNVDIAGPLRVGLHHSVSQPALDLIADHSVPNGFGHDKASSHGSRFRVLRLAVDVVARARECLRRFSKRPGQQTRPCLTAGPVHDDSTSGGARTSSQHRGEF